MGLKDLLDISDVNARPHATWKYDLPSRLETKTAEDRKDTADEATWKRAVWKRDKNICRYCECKVLKSLELQPKRGEVHHIVSRVDKAVRWDRRNGILLCATHHEAVERYQLHIIGTLRQMFTVGLKSYLNADKPLQFRKAEK